MDGPFGRRALFIAAVLTLWIYHGIDQSSVVEHPLSSQLLIPLLSSSLALIASFAARRLSRSPGRFDHGRDRKIDTSKTASLPQRPLRGSWALLPFLIAFRLYLLSWLLPRLQCSRAGVEAFLPLVLAVYDHYWQVGEGRTASASAKEEEEYNDIGLDTFEVLAHWFLQSPTPGFLCSALLTSGLLAVNSSGTSSTVICPASASSILVLCCQLSGLVLDAVILNLAWRTVQRARSVTDRLRSLGMILLTTVAFSEWLVLLQYSTADELSAAAAKSFSTLDFMHLSGQSAAFLFITATLLMTQDAPLAATTILVFLCGAYSAARKLFLVGTYEQLSKSQLLIGTSALGLGFMGLAYRTHIRHIGLPRSLLFFCLTAWVFGAMVYCALVTTAEPHAIDKIIYATRTEVASWLVQDAKVSDSLAVAVKEYQDRHNGRKPPPAFDVWYEYATKRDSPIIDHFRQIEEDLQPFWGLSPKHILERASELRAMHGVAIVRIKHGTVASQTSSQDPALTELVRLIEPFAKHLPDMELPVNLLNSPRVLPSWTQVSLERKERLPEETSAWSWEHQHQLGKACPPRTASSAGFYSPTAGFCGSCARPQSIGHFPTTASVSRDLCHQPDMLNLHGFYIDNHPLAPFSELLPVFGRAKTNQYRDILIPLSRGDSDYAPAATDEKAFDDKTDQLFWRGAVAAADPPIPPGLLRGGHQQRLSHLLNNASASAQITVLLAAPGSDELFQYQAASLQALNGALKSDGGISNYSACTVPECDRFKAEFGVKAADADGAAKAGSRYVMVMDGDDGPPADTLGALRSNSVPFVASVFKEWYTDRIFPWLHYVPIDLRFHGLYSTLAYFMGLAGDAGRTGSPGAMPPQGADARWIAQEGRRWAARALRREDAEVYLFRLLLEWGRVVDVRRDSLGFELGAAGGGGGGSRVAN